MTDRGPALSKPRIPPLPVGGGDAATQEVLDRLGEKASSNFFRTLAYNPRILKRWIPYSHVLFQGTLPDRDRELLVLRAAHRSDCFYEWDSHLPLARDAGLSEQEIEEIRGGAAGGSWRPIEVALVQAADELIDDHVVGDRTWAMLAERYDEQQLIEVPMVVGVYYAMGLTLNSLGVQPDGGVS
jgi:4-carboxymuconolactone decarboxylase